MSSDTSVILTRGAFFEGRLGFEGVARVFGRFKGEIVSEGTLIVEEGAQVEGQVEVGNLILKGWMKGQAKAKKSINIKKQAEFHGVLNTARLHIEPGALFEGRSVKNFVDES